VLRVCRVAPPSTQTFAVKNCAFEVTNCSINRAVSVADNWLLAIEPRYRIGSKNCLVSLVQTDCTVVKLMRVSAGL